MLHVRHFLQEVQWTGAVPGLGRVPARAAEVAMGRAARHIVETIADRLPSRSWEAGLRDLEKSKLSGEKYAPSTVRAVLGTLQRAGLVTIVAHCHAHLATLDPVWVERFDDAHLPTADRRTHSELLQTAPDDFARGLMYGQMLTRLELAQATGRAFV